MEKEKEKLKKLETLIADALESVNMLKLSDFLEADIGVNHFNNIASNKLSTALKIINTETSDNNDVLKIIDVDEYKEGKTVGDVIESKMNNLVIDGIKKILCQYTRILHKFKYVTVSDDGFIRAWEFHPGYSVDCKNDNQREWVKKYGIDAILGKINIKNCFSLYKIKNILNNENDIDLNKEFLPIEEKVKNDIKCLLTNNRCDYTSWGSYVCVDDYGQVFVSEGKPIEYKDEYYRTCWKRDKISGRWFDRIGVIDENNHPCVYKINSSFSLINI